MNGRQKLTKHPKTIQGKQLRKLSLRISNIHSSSSTARWVNDLKKFIENNLDYLLSNHQKMKKSDIQTKELNHMHFNY